VPPSPGELRVEYQSFWGLDWPGIQRLSSDRESLLTPRELQVAVLVRDGLTDREIADKLFITRRTAEWHVEQIFNKLGFNSRAQLAAWVADRAARSTVDVAAGRRHNLPLQLTAFVGRADELSEIRSLLLGRRLLTLTGVAGCGKTRLALQLASQSLDSYRDGVWFADLTPISDGQLVARAVCSALGVRERPRKPVMQTLVDHVDGRRLLLMLDNCEHVIDACAQLADTLLRSCPGTTLLATSREPLRLGGETVWRVPPMAVPDLLAPIDVDALVLCDAVCLFSDRAQLAAPDFHVTAENAAAVARLCHAMDGIPLAIELAAARTGVMAPAQILDRLRDRFGLLTGGSRTGPARHRSLQSAIDWSHDLLSDGERRLFRRLSVFAGSFNLESIEAICSGDDLEVAAIAGLLGSLVDKSLVSATGAGHDRIRFRLLDTLRQYGIERLAECGEEEMLHRRHWEFFLSLAETAFPNLRGHEQKEWRRRLVDEMDNLRSAFWRTHECEPEASLRLACALTPFWVLHGWVEEGDSWLEVGLRDSPTRNHLRAVALVEGGWVSTWCGDFSGAGARWQESLDICNELGDPKGVGQALTGLGWAAYWQGDLETAHKRYVDGLAMSRQGGDTREIATSLMFLGQSFLNRGDHDNARIYLEESLSWMEPLGDQRLRSYPLTWLGTTATETGDFETARSYLEEGLRIGKTLDFPLGVARALTDLAELAAAQSHSIRALRLAGAAEALYEPVSSARFSIEKPGLERRLERSRHELGPERSAVCWAEGRAMSQERAIEYALSDAE
jgi:predicted ATPase/DNA-binding CsgD family transcriptional regulator